jgi:hypothetical protein
MNAHHQAPSPSLNQDRICKTASISTMMPLGREPMPTAEQVGTAVDDFGMIAEVGLGVDHAEHFDDRLDASEFANRRFRERQQIQAGQTSRPISIVDGRILAKPPNFKGAIGSPGALAGEK